MAEDEPFLARWNRRKATARRQVGPMDAEPAIDDRPEVSPGNRLAPAAEEPKEEGDAPATQIDPDSLPDIDSLDEASDFSVFMQDGVPEALRTRALRKLWRLDPAFNVVDGLVEYGEDFTDLTAVAEGIKTAYKVGKGMVDDNEEPSEKDIAADETHSAGSAEPGRSTDRTSAEPTAAEDGPPHVEESDIAGSGTDANPGTFPKRG